MRLVGFYNMIKKPSVIIILASEGHQETSQKSLSMVNPQISIAKVAKVGVLPHELRKQMA